MPKFCFDNDHNVFNNFLMAFKQMRTISSPAGENPRPLDSNIDDVAQPKKFP